MQSFEFYSPTRVVFGPGREAEVGRLAQEQGATTVMLVYGGASALRSGLIDRIEASLAASGIRSFRFGGAKPNPQLAHAREGIRLALEEKADLILGIGGGSSIDTAKAIALGAANPELDIWEIWLKRMPLKTVLPIGAVPTIAAAGSEMSDSAVLDDDAQALKRGYGSDYIRPAFAVLDPELPCTLPRYQIACGVVDVMMHTMDRYFNPITTNMLTDEIAEGVLRTTIANGRMAVDDPKNVQAMSELMWCSCLSHNNLTGLGGMLDFAPHQLGHELSAEFDVAHGASLSAVWASWARYCVKTNPDRFVRFGKKVLGLDGEGLDGANHAIDVTEQLFRELDMPTCFSELGIGMKNERELARMVQGCSFDGKRTIGKFCVLDRDDMLRIYQMANH